MRTADVIPLAEPFSGPGTADTEMLIRKVADTLHRLNLQINNAVAAGVTVELIRGSRVHNGRGQWGDQMIPVVKMPAPPNDVRD